MCNMYWIYLCIDLFIIFGLGWVWIGVSELVDYFRFWCNYYLCNGVKLLYGKFYLILWVYFNFYLMKENDIKLFKCDFEFLKMFCYYVIDKIFLWI